MGLEGTAGLGQLSALLYTPFQMDFPKPEVLVPRVGIYLGHFLSVGLGVQGCLGEQGWMLLWGNTKFIVERVVPDLGGAQWRRSTMM